MLRERSGRTTAYCSEKCPTLGLQRATAAFVCLRPEQHPKVGRRGDRPSLAQALFCPGAKRGRVATRRCERLACSGTHAMLRVHCSNLITWSGGSLLRPLECCVSDSIAVRTNVTRHKWPIFRNFRDESAHSNSGAIADIGAGPKFAASTAAKSGAVWPTSHTGALERGSMTLQSLLLAIGAREQTPW
jgi:hypothetical protein